MQILIAYSRSDETIAQQLFKALRDKGFAVWFDRESLLPGQNWELEIERAIKLSEIVILLLSSNSVDQRGFFQKEMKLALSVMSTVPAGQIYLIPGRLENISVPDSLAPLQWVDLFPNPQGDGFRLVFPGSPFPGSDVELTWVREELGGNWYHSNLTGTEGWLCPALFAYFEEVPKKIYAKAECGDRKQSSWHAAATDGAKSSGG